MKINMETLEKKVRGVAIMNKIVIKVLGNDHGKDVFDFFKSKCPDALHRLEWDPYEYEKMFWKDRLYFGCDGGLFGWFTLEEVAENGFRAIELPEAEPEYPKVMEVSIYKDFRDSLKRVVFMCKNGMYLAWAGAATLEEADRELEVISWPYAREIAGNAERCMSGSESMSLKDQIHIIGLERIKEFSGD